MTEEKTRLIDDVAGEEAEAKVYELGFHLVSSIPTENVEGEVASIKAFLEKAKAVIISEEKPVLIPLAYEIAKTVKTKKTVYNKAYFGWVKFEAEAIEIPALQAALDGMDSVLRYIIIKTVKENTLYGTKLGKSASDAKEKKDLEEGNIVSPITEADLDKEIDNLVIE